MKTLKENVMSEKMNWNELISDYDKEDYLGRIREFPEQCLKGWEIGEKFNTEKFREKRFEKIIVNGMGGSGYSGYLLQNLLKDNSKIPVLVNNYYELPACADKKTLLIAISYSGNTEETLSVVKQAKKKKIPLIAITSGGALSEIEKNFIKVPIGIQPRQATGYLFFSMLSVLNRLKLVNVKEKEVNDTERFLKKEFNSLEIKAKVIAKLLFGKKPVVYVTENLRAVGVRWQTEFNEIGKQFLHWNVLPELQHNEINAFNGFEESIFFIIYSNNESKQMVKRIQFQEKRIKMLKKKVFLIETKGSNLLEELWYANYLGTLTSFYSAMLNKKNPTPVPVIEGLKKYLKK